MNLCLPDEYLDKGSNSLNQHVIYLIQPIKVGLNFLSFQNDPARLLFILTDPNWLGNSSFGGDSQFKDINKLLHVQACGIFFIPNIEKPFPGSCIFR